MPCSPVRVPPSATAAPSSSPAAFASALHHRAIAAVAEQRRVQVAVADVAVDDDGDVVGSADLVQPGDHLRDAAARHGDVFAELVARQPGDGRADAASRLPQRLRGFGRSRLLHIACAGTAQDIGHDGDLALHEVGVAVHRHQQQRLDVGRQAEMLEILDRLGRGSDPSAR